MTTRPVKPTAHTDRPDGLRAGTPDAATPGGQEDRIRELPLAGQGSTDFDELSLVLLPRRLKLMRLSLTSVALASAGILEGGFAGTISGALFALFSVGLGVSMLPGASFLRLGRNGFNCRSFFRTRTFMWDDVDGFEAKMVYGVEMVGFNSRRARQDYPSTSAVCAKVIGSGSALPDTYGLDAHELAALLNTARARARPCGMAWGRWAGRPLTRREP